MISAGDVQAGAIVKWNGDGMNTTVGPLAAGRQSGASGAYAVVKAKNTRNQFYTEGIPGSVYTSSWRLEIKIYGVGSAAVDQLLKLAGADFDVQSLVVTGASLLSCFPADGYPQLDEDPTRKAGEDWWQGVLGYDVALSGTA